jgi:hypothetical protein
VSERIQRALILCFFVAATVFTEGHAYAAAPSEFTLESVLGFPFPATLVAGDDGRAAAWVIAARGIREAHRTRRGPAAKVRPYFVPLVPCGAQRRTISTKQPPSL